MDSEAVLGFSGDVNAVLPLNFLRLLREEPAGNRGDTNARWSVDWSRDHDPDIGAILLDLASRQVIPPRDASFWNSALKSFGMTYWGGGGAI